MKRDNVEIFEDSNVITLYDDDENPVEFYEIACVELDDKLDRKSTRLNSSH